MRMGSYYYNHRMIDIIGVLLVNHNNHSIIHVRDVRYGMRVGSRMPEEYHDGAKQG